MLLILVKLYEIYLCTSQLFFGKISLVVLKNYYTLFSKFLQKLLLKKKVTYVLLHLKIFEAILINTTIICIKLTIKLSYKLN